MILDEELNHRKQSIDKIENFSSIVKTLILELL